MILDIVLTIFSFIINTIGSILKFISGDFSLWPDSVLNGLTYVCETLMKLNIFFPIDTLLQAIKYLFGFFSLWVVARLVIMIFNFFRGSGEMKL